MESRDFERMIGVLESIRDQQRQQLEHQNQALVLQREQFALVQKQAERVERIQDRAEKLQEGSSQIVARSRRAAAVVLPIILALVVYVSWLIFRLTTR